MSLDSVLFPLFFFGAMFLLQLKFPVSGEDYRLGKSSDLKALGKKYLKYNWLTVIFLFLLVPSIALGMAYLFNWAGQYLFFFLGEYELAVLPNFWVWMFPAAFLSVVVFYHLMERFYRWHLKENYAEMRAFYNATYGYDGWKAMRWINGLLIFASAAFFIFVSAYYTAFYKNEMVYSPFFSFAEHSYKYEEIETLAKVDHFIAPNGNKKHAPHFAIIFKDGENWDSRSNGHLEYEEDIKTIYFLMEKTGLPLEELDLID